MSSLKKTKIIELLKLQERERERLFNKRLKCFVLIKYGPHSANLNSHSTHVLKTLINFILLVIFY